MVDILLPTYKPKAEHLRAALDSLLGQTEQDWQLWICDEPTEVDTKAMLEPYLCDERVHVAQNEKRLGIGGNWNACLECGEAPVVQFLFQDDLWEPQYLERGLRILQEHPSVGMVSIEHSYKDEGVGDIMQRFNEVQNYKHENVQAGAHVGLEFLEWWIDHELWPNVIGEPPFVMLRRSVVEHVGPFDVSMQQNLDVEYWIRCLLQTDWYYCTEDLGTFRLHADAASAANRSAGTGAMDRLICVERLMQWLPNGNLRQKTVTARNRAYQNMIQDYFARKRQGNAVSLQGSSGAKWFALKHPILTVRGLLQAAKPAK